MQRTFITFISSIKFRQMFESQFTGRILGDENVEKATIAFSKVVSVRVGRKYYDYTYKYSFVGNK